MRLWRTPSHSLSSLSLQQAARLEFVPAPPSSIAGFHFCHRYHQTQSLSIDSPSQREFLAFDLCNMEQPLAVSAEDDPLDLSGVGQDDSKAKLTMETDPALLTGGTTAEDWRNALNKVVPAVVVMRTTVTRAFDTEPAGANYATGFIVDKARGIILTNRHVVKPGISTGMFYLGVRLGRDHRQLVGICIAMQYLPTRYQMTATCPVDLLNQFRT